LDQRPQDLSFGCEREMSSEKRCNRCRLSSITDWLKHNIQTVQKALELRVSAQNILPLVWLKSRHLLFAENIHRILLNNEFIRRTTEIGLKGKPTASQLFCESISPEGRVRNEGTPHNWPLICLFCGLGLCLRVRCPHIHTDSELTFS
jgi:hypothetical protein